MARVKHKVVGSGVFFSPALNADAPYELLDVIEGRTVTSKAVRCVQSQQIFDIDTLSRPTNAQMIDQVSAAFREVGAWLVANAPNNPARHRGALRMIRRTIRDNYLSDDLQRDVAWIAQADLGARIAFLNGSLNAEGKEEMVVFAATIGSTGGDLSPTDAEFIERLGTGLGLPVDRVYELVISSVTSSAA
jgi:hypothetical protein